MADSLSRWLARRHVHYGWVVLAIAFLTMLTSSAALGLPGVFLQPLSREFGWNTGRSPRRSRCASPCMD